MKRTDINKAIADGKAMRLGMVRNFFARMFGATPQSARA